ncbi:MAG: alginate export family protein [Acidobacteriota bacterium]
MMKRSTLLLFGLSLSLLQVAPAIADDGEPIHVDKTFAEAVASGKLTVALRHRFETVDQDGFASNAEASTLRTTVSYGSAPYRGFRFFVEAENVTAIPDDDDYNNAGGGSLNNGVSDRPVVADPELTQLSQAFIEMVISETTLRAGRQEINLGNQRFVGAVGWRQHHQSFDSFSVLNKSSKHLAISYHYLDRVHRIFGDRLDMSSHLLHARFMLGAQDKLTAYGYLLDYDDLVALSTQTIGLRWSGHRANNWARTSYVFEAAIQEDAGDNPNRVDAEYLHAELASGTKAFTVTAGYESLSGSPEDGAFATPLATLHKFNGWADKFLRTPTEGLVDLYLGLGGAVGKKFNWKLIYHDFQPEGDGDDYGTELDLLAVFKARKGLTFGLKTAFYEADAFATDTEKFWFWTAYKFSR